MIAAVALIGFSRFWAQSQCTVFWYWFYYLLSITRGEKIYFFLWSLYKTKGLYIHWYFKKTTDRNTIFVPESALEFFDDWPSSDTSVWSEWPWGFGPLLFLCAEYCHSWFSHYSVTSSKWKMTSSFFASTLYTSFDSCIYIGVDQWTLT